MPDFDYHGPAVPFSDQMPGGRRPFVAPIQIRLVGRDLDVTAALDVLRDVFTVAEVTSLYRARGGRVRLYAVVSREVPLRGGVK